MSSGACALWAVAPGPSLRPRTLTLGACGRSVLRPGGWVMMHRPGRCLPASLHNCFSGHAAYLHQATYLPCRAIQQYHPMLPCWLLLVAGPGVTCCPWGRQLAACRLKGMVQALAAGRQPRQGKSSALSAVMTQEQSKHSSGIIDTPSLLLKCTLILTIMTRQPCTCVTRRHPGGCCASVRCRWVFMTPRCCCMSCTCEATRPEG